jgi:hypothetical protein
VRIATTIVFPAAAALAVAVANATGEPNVDRESQSIVHAITPATLRSTFENLRDDQGRLPEDTILQLLPGHYELRAVAFTDSTCGNCEDPETHVSATLGLRLSGRRIALEGRGAADSVMVHTRAGYGILFENCEECRIANLTLTDGLRDSDGNATDAAIVVRNSSVDIEACRIVDNIGDSTAVSEVVVGIIGVAGREGSRMRIVGNHILRNSWDGIALYRGAQATIEDNVIDGVDKARGGRIGGGRGVGIGVTWDARATIRRNRVTRYWKGIGVFVDAQADVSENVVEEVLTWGIAYWDAGKGRPVARIESNVVYDTGACGISITRATSGSPAPGYCLANVVLRTGQNPKYDDPDYYCTQCPIAVEAQPNGFTVADNLLFDNRRAPTTRVGDAIAGAGSTRVVDLVNRDLKDGDFLREVAPLYRRLSAIPSLHDARCLRAIGTMLASEGRSKTPEVR